jgi:hypothetical protein
MPKPIVGEKAEAIFDYRSRSDARALDFEITSEDGTLTQSQVPSEDLMIELRALNRPLDIW